jgi:hypothetical protein
LQITQVAKEVKVLGSLQLVQFVDEDEQVKQLDEQA